MQLRSKNGKRRKRAAGITVAAALLAAAFSWAAVRASAATSCSMPYRFTDPKLALEAKGNSLFWVRPLQVNIDGAPNAYNQNDPHGKKGLAIEYIGYGMRILNNGNKIPFKTDEKKNRPWLVGYEILRANRWKASGGYSADIFGFLTSDSNGKKCKPGPKGELVSTTSLTLKKTNDECDQGNYLDATLFPGIVLPRRAKGEKAAPKTDRAIAPPFAVRGARLGDLAIVYSTKSDTWKGALVFDTGPRKDLGEGSVALIVNLTGQPQPTTAEMTNKMAIAETYVVLFPGSVEDIGDKKDWTPKLIEDAAASRFMKWGNGSLDAAKQRLLACAKEYKKKR
jgi:hypothetical protein